MVARGRWVGLVLDLGVVVDVRAALDHRVLSSQSAASAATISSVACLRRRIDPALEAVVGPGRRRRSSRPLRSRLATARTTAATAASGAHRPRRSSRCACGGPAPAPAARGRAARRGAALFRPFGWPSGQIIHRDSKSCAVRVGGRQSQSAGGRVRSWRLLGSRRSTLTLRSWGPVWRAVGRARAAARRDARSWCWRLATAPVAGSSRSRSATASGSTSAGNGSGRPRTVCTSWRARMARHLPDLDGGRERDRARRSPDALHGHDPEAAPARDGGRRTGDGAPRPDGEEGAHRCALECAEGQAMGQPDGLVLDAPQHGDPERPRDDGDRREGRLGRDPRGRLAAAPALLHRLGGQLRPAARHRGRRAAGPLRAGSGHRSPVVSPTASATA